MKAFLIFAIIAITTLQVTGQIYVGKNNAEIRKLLTQDNRGFDTSTTEYGTPIIVEPTIQKGFPVTYTYYFDNRDICLSYVITTQSEQYFNWAVNAINAKYPIINEHYTTPTATITTRQTQTHFEIEFDLKSHLYPFQP